LLKLLIRIRYRTGPPALDWGPRSIKAKLLLSLLAALLLIAGIPPVNAQNSVTPLRLGFSRSLFKDFKEVDARAAVLAWAQILTREQGINMEPSALIFERVAEMIPAMKNGRVDAVSLNYLEYRQLTAEVKTKHHFAASVGGSITNQYAILVSKEGGIETLADLKGEIIYFHDVAKMSLAMAWLDLLIVKNRHAESHQDFFGGFKPVSRAAKAILPVFFGKAKSALVTQASFKIMCELNPQLKQKLRVLAKSRPIVPALICFRENFDPPQMEQFLQVLGDLHTNVSGKQVLNIFKADSLIEVDPGVFQGGNSLLTEVERLRKTFRKAKVDFGK
jgi:ABC-type phosphate/phosphonate transport system substrate-binding protein